MEIDSYSLVIGSKGAPIVKRFKNSYILSYPCENYYDCTEYKATLPKGKYKLEVWGAEGGTRSANVSGGRGGYSSGILTLSSPQLLFFSIGSKGGFASMSQRLSLPTFGGGGCSSTDNTSINPPRKSSNGGGGTDIRIESNNINSRIIVGGGGGGTGTADSDDNVIVFPGGFGGGSSGSNGTSDGSTKGGQGGNQTAGGISAGSGSKSGLFGFGGSTIVHNYWGCGGGGGWFGGSNGNDYAVGGGGGSGYVLTKESYIPTHYAFNHTCDFVLTEPILKNGGEPFPSPFEINETGHIGNGFAKITFLDLTLPSVQTTQCCRSRTRFEKAIHIFHFLALMKRVLFMGSIYQ